MINKPSECDHDYKLDSTIPFEDMAWEFAVRPPPGKKYQDMEFCVKCGSVKRFIWDDYPTWQEDNPDWRDDYPDYKENDDPKAS